MILFLTSAGFRNMKIANHFAQFLTKHPSKIKVLFIPTAAITPEEKSMIPLCKEDLTKIGILENNITNYNLDKPISNEDIVKYDVMYVCGGEPNHLLCQMHHVHFNNTLKTFLQSGGIYIGVSAGSMVLGNNYENGYHYIPSVLRVHRKKGTASGTLDSNKNSIVYLTDQQAIIKSDNRLYIIE